MKFLLKFGCWGRTQNNFISCPGAENCVLDLTAPSELNKGIIDFLDEKYSICDKPIYNNVHSAVWNIQNEFSIKGKPVFDRQLFNQIEEFCKDHVKCGLFLRIELVEKE